MNILLANNPREKYAVGDTIPGTLNNGMMEDVYKRQGVRYSSRWSLAISAWVSASVVQAS